MTLFDEVDGFKLRLKDGKLCCPIVERDVLEFKNKITNVTLDDSLKAWFVLQIKKLRENVNEVELNWRKGGEKCFISRDHIVSVRGIIGWLMANVPIIEGDLK